MAGLLRCWALFVLPVLKRRAAIGGLEEEATDSNDAAGLRGRDGRRGLCGLRRRHGLSSLRVSGDEQQGAEGEGAPGDGLHRGIIQTGVGMEKGGESGCIDAGRERRGLAGGDLVRRTPAQSL